MGVEILRSAVVVTFAGGGQEPTADAGNGKDFPHQRSVGAVEEGLQPGGSQADGQPGRVQGRVLAAGAVECNYEASRKLAAA